MLVSAPAKNGYLYMGDASNLTRLWERKTGSTPWIATRTGTNVDLFDRTPPATAAGTAFNLTFFSLDALTRAARWRIGLAGSISKTYGAPTWINHVLVVNDETYVYVLNSANGTSLFTSQPGGEMIPPAPVRGVEILVGHGDNLTAYGVTVGAPSGIGHPVLGTSLAGGSLASVLARARD
jgi:outer membrane protein assembly factor BamB